jgi:hypothetical protein
MAKKKENMKKRYRKGGPARLDMRKGGRVSLQMGGGFNPTGINIPTPNISVNEEDIKLTPTQLEDIQKVQQKPQQETSPKQEEPVEIKETQEDVSMLSSEKIEKGWWTPYGYDNEDEAIQSGEFEFDIETNTWIPKTTPSTPDTETETDWNEGDVNPENGLIYSGTDENGDPIWRRPEGISEDATWNGAEWIEPSDTSSWNEGDVNPETGLIYGGTDENGDAIWNRPEGISEDATWNGTEWIEPSDTGLTGWWSDFINPDTGTYFTTEDEAIGSGYFNDDGSGNYTPNQDYLDSMEGLKTWWEEAGFDSEEDATASGWYVLDADGNLVLDDSGNPTEGWWREHGYDRQVQAIASGNFIPVVYDEDGVAQIATTPEELREATWIPREDYTPGQADERQSERMAMTEKAISAARQGKIINEAGEEIDLDIPDPVKANYVYDSDGNIVLDAEGKPKKAVKDQSEQPGKIIEFDEDGNRFVREATATEAGGFLMNAAEDDYERYPTGHPKAGQPIPAIRPETVSTVDIANKLTKAQITGYQRNSQGELLKDDNDQPIPITAKKYTAAQVPNFLRNEDGTLQLDGNNNPIPIGDVEAAQIDTVSITDDSDSIAKLSDIALALSSDISGASVTLTDDLKETQSTVTGTISPNSKMLAITEVAGTTLPRVLRAKKQLRRAGLSEEDINVFANDPDVLEDKVLEYTEAERGMIAGLPEEALVNVQLNSLLEGIESGEIPVFARPAVSAVNQIMAERGLDASTVGRDNLFNAIITAALPIAQQNAQSIKESVVQQRSIEAQAAELNAQMEQQRALSTAENSFNMDMADMSAELQKEVNNSKFFQTVALTESNNEQQATIQEALNKTQIDLAVLNTRERLAVRNADAFLQMDLTNLNNEQQANVLNAQMEQQRLLSNQAADNAAKQFNAASDNQLTQFMSNLAAQTDQFNATQKNAMEQFNVTQDNAAEARRVGREADIAKFNAQLVTQTDQFNAQQEFARVQWNAQNAAAVEQSNTQWRRQANLADTAAQNAVNMQNAQNSFQLSTQALAFMWQELRDQADFDFRKAENAENRKAQIIATALANESDAWETYDDYLTILISSLANAYGTEYGGAGGGP